MFRRLAFAAAAEPAPGGAKADEPPRPLPPPPPAPPPDATAQPPKLPADQLHEISQRVTALEKKPVTTIGAGAIFLVAVIALGFVLGLAALFARLVRREK